MFFVQFDFSIYITYISQFLFSAGRGGGVDWLPKVRQLVPRASGREHSALGVGGAALFGVLRGDATSRFILGSLQSLRNATFQRMRLRNTYCNAYSNS